MKSLTNSVDKYPLLGCDFCTIDIGHVLVKYPSTYNCSAATYPMLFFFQSVIFGSNNNFLQFIVTLNNMATMLENFIQICGMARIKFSEFLAIPKCN
jgi:hypothetical protein